MPRDVDYKVASNTPLHTTTWESNFILIFKMNAVRQVIVRPKLHITHSKIDRYIVRVMDSAWK